MKKIRLIYALSVVVFSMTLLMACSAEKSESKPVNRNAKKPMIVNGVERSELALLMRKMYDEMKLAQDSLLSGYTVRASFLDEFRRIHDATPTEPEKIDTNYHRMAAAFLDNYAIFEQTHENQINAFNIMIQNCLVCHQQKCPGPVKAINKLRIRQ